MGLFKRDRTGVWLPKEGRYSKLEKGQYRPSTKLCIKEGHELSEGTIPCPLYAKHSFKCGRCGFETPNPAFRPSRARKFWEEYDLKMKSLV